MKPYSFDMSSLEYIKSWDQKTKRLNSVMRILLANIVLTLLLGCGTTIDGITDTPTILLSDTPTVTPMDTPTPTATPLSADWIEKVSNITWVAYSPPSGNPNTGLEATIDTIKEDLVLLKKAGFTGLVTYGSSGIMGSDFPSLAQEAGFEGIIMGVWDLHSQEEVDAAKKASQIPIVLGFSIGNEGLYERYELEELSKAIDSLRTATSKPVTTTEQIDDYVDESLLNLGDWIFPNVHPYFHSRLEPDEAVKWTVAAYEDLNRRTDQFVLFKEVGLPTQGDPDGKLSEVTQEQYYVELAKSNILFVYFEAFDQPWKTNLPIEPHWGIFLSDGTPKRIGWRLLGMEPPSETTFYVYWDADYADNHFTPSGYMGDIGDILIDRVYEQDSHSGFTSIRVVYDAIGKGPNECDYSPPCKWAGVYWQQPPNNWGETEAWKNEGFDLSEYTNLKFWAKGGSNCTIEFLVGGIGGPYGDSLVFKRNKLIKLTERWQEYLIDLSDANLTYIIGGFGWVSNWQQVPAGCTFLLDDIRFEK